MLTFILYIIMYLVLGLIYGKLRKNFDDHTENKDTDYALTAILWLPLSIAQAIGLVYKLYKKYV